jgi:hypothetical protein
LLHSDFLIKVQKNRVVNYEETGYDVVSSFCPSFSPWRRHHEVDRHKNGSGRKGGADNRLVIKLAAEIKKRGFGKKPLFKVS